MAAARSNLVLFGFDLAQLPTLLRQGWSEALQWPFFARLLPPEPVRVRLPDGERTVWPPGGDAKAIVANAVVLPEGLLLRRTLPMPSLAAAAQREAIELAISGASPFPLENTVWGWRSTPTETGCEVELAMAAREHVADYLARTVNEHYLGEIEVWAAGENGRPPVVIGGFGEARRLARSRRRYWRIGGLAVLALGLTLALAASPVLRQRWDMSDFDARYAEAGRQAREAMADRDALAQANVRLMAIAAYADAHPEPQKVLGRLSALLPDSVYLTRLELQGRSVTVAGLAENAAGIMEILSAQPDFDDIRAPAAITRDPTSKRESFTIEFRLKDTATPATPAETEAPER
ncbi:MAG: PilN domain-containing protein [Azoarcus sp.]|jgi:general secretion pathway protein L|nr:PilN domain-containing protein [Azoarcus sp.]